MKLTQRDKKLLTGLAIFILTVVYINFLLLPKINNIAALKSDIATLNNTYAMNMVFKDKSQSLDSDIKILSEKLKTLRAIYPPSINSDELLITLSKLVKETDMEIASMNFELARVVETETSNTAAAQETALAPAVGTTTGQSGEINKGLSVGAKEASGIMDYFYLWGLISQQGAEKTEEAVIPDGKGYYITVKVEGQGTKDQIKKFLSHIKELENVVYCKNFTIEEQNAVLDSTEEAKLKFSAELQFLGIMDKGAGEYYLLENGNWVPMPAAGKDNIFVPYEGYNTEMPLDDIIAAIAGANKENDTNPKKDNSFTDYDFSVIASAFGGGLAPSVSVSCMNPGSRVSYASPIVYGDNRGMENAEIFIEQKGGKYFCKFKTDHEAYPDKLYSETLEFIPTGKDLKLRILSFPRSDKDDKSGINLSIINNSDKKLVYQVKNDDPVLPRVKIGKTAGSVEVKKN